MAKKGWFQLPQLPQVKPPTALIPKCGKCGLKDKCKSPLMKPYGEGKKGILIVGEAPGKTEDDKGRPFVGESGQLLRDSLKKCGVNLDRDCWVTNSLICHPQGNIITNEAMIDYCRPNLVKTISQLNPTTVILLGSSAVKSLIGHLWKEDAGGVTRWVGYAMPNQRLNAWVCVTYHPSFVLRSANMPLVGKTFDNHLKSFTKLKSRPWDKVPDYESEVELIYEPDRAAIYLNKITSRGGVVAFDYETDRLKPDSDGSSILCAAVSWQGRKTIAYPWCGSAIDATKRLLRSDVGKVIANSKFEFRWTMKEFGVAINNVVWDTMLAAHVLDNRPGISGLKFQAFARLGVDSYDWYLEEQRKGKGSNGKNRLRDVPLKDLLKYCGADALLEYKLYELQREEINENEKSSR